MPRPSWRSLAGLSCMAMVAFGCGDAAENGTEPRSTESSTATVDSTSSTTTTPTTTTTTTTVVVVGTTTTVAAPTTTLPPDVPGPSQEVLDTIDVGVELVASADVPIDMAVHPGTDRVLLAQRGGTIVEFDDDTVGSIVLDLHPDIAVEGEGGLLSITFDPAGEHLYVSFTNADTDTRVVAYEVDDGIPDPERAHVVFELEQPEIIHNGGQIRFGRDGFLYIGLGDGGPGNDPDDRAQRLDTLFGKILRIDPTPGGAGAYEVPDDNPFVDVAGALPEIWSYGLRNPWRFTFDRANGDLWIGDVGQFVAEEINWVSAGTGGAGANFGWARFEGPIRRGPEPTDHVEAVRFYNHDEGRCSVIGGVVYRGDVIPDLRGAYIFGDYCDGKVRALTLEDGAVVAERDLDLQLDLLTSIAEGPGGEIYVFSLAGDVRRLAAA